MLHFLLTNMPGQFEDRWLNFKIDVKDSSTFINALQSHGWKWEDDVPFTLANNWWDDSCTYDAASCMKLNADGKFSLNNCKDPYYYALCEYNLPEQSTLLPTTTVLPDTTEFQSTSPNLSTTFYSSLKTQLLQVTTQSITIPLETTSNNFSTVDYSFVKTQSLTVTLPPTTSFEATSISLPCLYRFWPRLMFGRAHVRG